MSKKIIVLILGIYLGFVLMRTEVVSWFRIQEMFRFRSFHMYGIIGLAVIIGVITVQIVKRTQAKAINGEPIQFKSQKITKANFIGGSIFGLGWAMTGACPGPLYSLIGNGYPIIAVSLVSAVLGAFIYGLLRDKLPH